MSRSEGGDGEGRAGLERLDAGAVTAYASVCPRLQPQATWPCSLMMDQCFFICDQNKVTLLYSGYYYEVILLYSM